MRATFIKNETFRWGELLLVFVIVGNVSADSSPSKSYEFPTNQQVIAFLTETIDWFRALSAQQQIATEPVDILFFEDDQSLGIQIAELSFDYAKTDAALGGRSAVWSAPRERTATPDVQASYLQHLMQMEKQSETESQKARVDLDSIHTKLLTAHKAADRKKLEAAAVGAQTRISLLQARSTSLRSLVQFGRTTGDRDPRNADLESIIEDLSRTLPELANRPSPTAPVSQNLPAPSATKAGNSSILGLISDVSALGKKLQTLDKALRTTDRLAQSSQNLRAPLAQFVHHTLQSDDLGSDNPLASDLNVLRSQKAQLDALTQQISSLSPALVALDKQRILLGVYTSHLVNWRSSVVNQYALAWKKVVLHLAALLIVIVLLALGAAALRRLIIHRVRDANRRRMILIVQRVLLWLSVLLVIAFAFASDLSSLATFLGLLTGGVAVALQNVILAVLGYFLLVGKLGIREGDRVQISGVTGQLVDLGLLQFQVREIDAQEQPTGRVASFSNSFIFVSPATGMFKVDPSAPRARE